METKRAIQMKNAANFLFTFPYRWMRVHKMCQDRKQEEIILTISFENLQHIKKSRSSLFLCF